MKLLSNIAFFIFALPICIFCQNKGKVLIISNNYCEGYIDGEFIGILEKEKPSIYELTEGEHYIQAKFKKDGDYIEKNDILTIEADKQKVVKFEFSSTENLDKTSNHESSKNSQISPIQVAKLETKIPGTLTVAIWEMNNSKRKYNDYPRYHIAFEQGDKVQFTCISSNPYIPSIIKIKSYETGVEILSKEFTSIQNQEIFIQQRGIFIIELQPSIIQGADLNASIDIKRIPKDESTINFNTSVSKRNFEVVQILSPAVHYLNSSTNISSGNFKVSVSVTLPPNTIEWYYIVTATRDRGVVEQTKQKFHLAENLATAVANLNPSSKILSIGLDLLTAPPGDDYCDVFILDAYSNGNFLNNSTFYPYPEGKRINISSGKVQINKIYHRDLYIGLRNTDTFHGVNVIIEAAAIVQKESYYINE
jgi:hypothetical protein